MDELTDDDLAAVNSLLPWSCFTVDSSGRRFGDSAWPGKRDAPQPLPDRRVLLMDERFGLRGRAVLEVGCFEGVHTIALCRLGADVTALDSRIENAVKTMVRAGLYGCAPRVLVRDLEHEDALAGLDADLAHHVGVLYHLEDPVTHLYDLGRHVGAVMLDTHVAESASASYDAMEQRWGYAPYSEGGRADVFSGMRAQARWLTLDVLRDALALAGFARIDVIEEREERNGRRVLLFAER